ncbi:hypothetical protein COLO4_28423 [Corchorus olitorius]|uniref:Protein ENHANCED DISEASE RESISTANCE 2 C-terminal domain-containing protein n=1 Tax=Corchorus olitorius TaxID=93759 RepID=A0A1R3HKR1_9ROSI|nr:hypothetical protein COLO4_28423 [Corchorus olitorius]
MRMLERVAALRELFKANQGNYSSELLPRELTVDIDLPQIENVDVKIETKSPKSMLKTEGDSSIDNEMEKPRGSHVSLMGMNDAPDEFFDVPEFVDYEHLESEWSTESSELQPPNMQQSKLATAAGFVRKLQDLARADFLISDKREDDLGGRLGGIVQVPGTPMYTIAMYYMIKTPLEDHPSLYNFVNGDDAYRNSRFKLIPYISKVEIDVGSSTVARGVANLVLGYLNNLVVEMAFVIQGNTQEELPESLLGTCRLNHLDVSKAPPAMP